MRWLLTFTLSIFGAFLVVALAISIWTRGQQAQTTAGLLPDSTDRQVSEVDCSNDPPPPLHCGDRIDLRRLPMSDIVVWWQSPPKDGEVRYAIYDANGPLLENSFVAHKEDPSGKWLEGADVFNKILLMSLAILIIAKGRDPRLAYPAGIFLYGTAAGSGIISTLVGLPWWLIVAVQSIRQVLLAISLYALFDLSTELAKHAYSQTFKKWLNLTGAVFVFGMILPVLLAGAVRYPLELWPPDRTFLTFFYGLPVVAKVAPLAIMAYAIAREKADDIVLLHWIFASTLVGFSGPLVKETSSALHSGSTHLNPLILTESLMALGYGYALIKRRLVSVSFVLNHAAVFSVLAGIAAIGFGLASEFIKPDPRRGPVVYVLVLLIGVSLNYLRPQVETLIRHLGSAHRLTFQEGLAALIEDCRRMKTVDDVTTVSVQQLCRLASLRACALYERQKGRLVRVAFAETTSSPTAFPLLLSEDDQVVLRMESTRRASDAASAGAPLVTALPLTSTAFPMVVSDQLIGVVAVEPIDQQQLHDPDVRRDLRTFAHELGHVLAFKRSQYCDSTEPETAVANRLSPA